MELQNRWVFPLDFYGHLSDLYKRLRKWSPHSQSPAEGMLIRRICKIFSRASKGIRSVLGIPYRPMAVPPYGTGQPPGFSWDKRVVCPEVSRRTRSSRSTCVRRGNGSQLACRSAYFVCLRSVISMRWVRTAGLFRYWMGVDFTNTDLRRPFFVTISIS